MKSGKMVWVLSTAVGITAHSTPSTESTGSATVREHRPRQEMSCMLATRFIVIPPFSGQLGIVYHDSGYKNRTSFALADNTR